MSTAHYFVNAIKNDEAPATTWTTSEVERTRPAHLTSEGDAFMRAMWTLEMLPLNNPLTRDDLMLISKSGQHDANTVYLNRVASF